jgi:hypothetical protein
MTQSDSVTKQVPCPKCKNMLVLQTVAVGSKRQCPHCKAVFVISSGKTAQREDAVVKNESIPREEGSSVPGAKSFVPNEASVAPKCEGPAPKDDDGYGLKLDANPAAGDARRDAASRIVNRAEHIADKSDKEQVEAWRPKRPPPARLFRNHTFKAPFEVSFRKCLIMLLVLSLIMGIATALLLPYLDIGGKESKDAGGNSDVALKNLALVRSFDGLSSGAQSTGAVFVLILLGAPFLIATSGIAVAIFRDTFEGFDKFESWPREWLNGILISVSFIVVPLFLSAFPSLLICAFLPGIGWLRMPIVVVCTLILFPLFFLSALDSKSPVMLYSKPVWNSLQITFPIWKIFYISTIAIGAAIALFLSIPIIAGLKVIFLAMLLPFCVMAYFRLLGKLAWYCSGGYEESIKAEE